MTNTVLQSVRERPDLADRLAQARVLVVGDVMLDRYWFGDCERISPEAPVPVAKISRMEERAGGPASSRLFKAEYANITATPLTAEVKAGPQTLDLDVQ